MDTKLIKNLLAGMSYGQSEYDKLLWKPKHDTDYTVRIIPYKYNIDFPFFDIIIHEKLGPGFKFYNSPATFGEYDPIIEYGEKLKQTGIKEDKALAQQFLGKKKTLCLIIVRGEEDKGVLIWQMPSGVKKQIFTFIANEDFEDITDPINGHDLKVKLNSPKGTGGKFEWAITPRPKKTPTTEDKNMMEVIKNNQPKFEDIWHAEPADKLTKVLANYLKTNTDKDSQDFNKEDSGNLSKNDTNVNDESTKKVEPPKVTTNAKKIEDFDSLFESKKK
jgi:hypothetical protein